MTPAAYRTQEATQAVLTEAMRFGLARLQRTLPAGKLAVPERIVVSPKPMEIGTAERAAELYRGRFAFGGELCTPGAVSPFACAPPSERWRDALQSFVWLKDLAKADSELSRAQARSLIADWIAVQNRVKGPGWDAPVLARRVISWLRHAPFYLPNAGAPFHDKLMVSLGRQVRHLLGTLGRSGPGLPRLQGAVAASFAVVCTEGLERYTERADDNLARELERQIHPDGGHISRNPEVALDLLADLVPLREAYLTRDMMPPGHLVAAIDRLYPLLRLFLHGDGGLALFNGANGTRRQLVAAILAEDAEQARPLTSARQSGYSRLEQGGTVVIADTGSTRGPRYDTAGQAGCLSFEMSRGTQRIVVNCGHCGHGPVEWRTATAATAAHSTLAVADRSNARIFTHRLFQKLFGGPLMYGPETVEADVECSDAGALLNASHDGYLGTFGLIHRREIYVSDDGSDIRGHDRLYAPADAAAAAQPGEPVTARFHLHPSIKANPSQDSSSIILMLPDRSGWRFSAKGADISIEESVYFANRDVPHRTLQIVLSAQSTADLTVRWGFKLIEKPGAPGSPQHPAHTRLPLEGGAMNVPNG